MDGRSTIGGVSKGRLWFVLSGGAVAWTAHLMMSYAVAEFGCTAGLGRRGALGLSAVAWMLLAVSAATAALALWALLAAAAVGRRAAAAGAPHPDDRATAAYVARFGLIADGLFLFIILVESVPILFYLSHC